MDPRKRTILLQQDDDDVQDVDEVLPEQQQQPSPHPTPLTTNVTASTASTRLIGTIITPSPYPQHNSGNSRFRNAIVRITADCYDTEAWEALVGEVLGLYEQLPSKSAPESFAKLDWIESCYGSLLNYFPYSTTHICKIAEILLTQMYGIGLHNLVHQSRRTACQAKLNWIFQHYLVSDSDDLKLCSWVVELWLVYIKYVELSNNRDEIVVAYDQAVEAAGGSYNNHLLWKSYLDFIKSWNGTDPITRKAQMVQLRSVYQKLVFFPMTGLDQLWQEYVAFENEQSEALAAALIKEYEPRYKHARNVYLERNRIVTESSLQLGRLAAPPVPVDEDASVEYVTKMQEEYELLKIWKTRCSYERTNPMRFELPQLFHRLRSVFSEMACVLTLYPETWSMWSGWESSQENHPKAIQVLQLAQTHIPDSTLLAFSEAQIVERMNGMACCGVLERFLNRSPNTLGFVIYQQLVRRYKGKDAARAVFARARQTLRESVVVNPDSQEDDKAEGEEQEMKKDEENGNRWVVTNRLDPAIGTTVSPEVNGESETEAGPITWHLYASHAIMEHRLNRNLDVAARVYELGLRKHSSFLTVPTYIERYAQLLLELNDTTNLRALLTRAVSACEAEKKQGALVSLCDMMLNFESVTACDSSTLETLQKIEKRRREALMGPDVEDVATGGLAGSNDAALIGAQKSTIGEQLIRSDGYDVSSRIVSGLSRAVDVLNIAGLWGSGESISSTRKESADKDSSADNAGGSSDESFLRRKNYQGLADAGMPQADNAGAAGSRVVSTRERLAGGVGGTSGQQTAIMLAIQQSPAWLRPLLLLLPASRLRLPIVAKPPPHLTEMALASIQQNELPAERPADDSSKKRSRATVGDGNSSDEEGNNGGSGYGVAFRNRQQARIAHTG